MMIWQKVCSGIRFLCQWFSHYIKKNHTEFWSKCPGNVYKYVQYNKPWSWVSHSLWTERLEFFHSGTITHVSIRNLCYQHSWFSNTKMLGYNTTLLTEPSLKCLLRVTTTILMNAAYVKCKYLNSWLQLKLTPAYMFYTQNCCLDQSIGWAVF
jgi:hypothetical protein